LHFITHKVQRCIPALKAKYPNANENDMCSHVTRENILMGVADLKSRSSILEEMNYKGEIKIVGALYDISTGVVEFLDA
jgi:carbonic anhydrase